MSLRQRILGRLGFGHDHSCHGQTTVKPNNHRKVVIVGSPNVGKSAIFNSLTGAYVTVSNYPGTTVNLSRGTARLMGEEYEVVDTPGMYSLLPITEEERVARSILLNGEANVVIHIVDAKNLERMLPLTLQLIEMGLPLILVLNMMDEAEAEGIDINLNYLQQELGIPVVTTVATTGKGMKMLQNIIDTMARQKS